MKKTVSSFFFTGLVILMGNSAWAEPPAPRACYNVCWDCGEKNILAKCKAVDSHDKHICYVLFGACERQADHSCGWSARKNNPDLQKCLANPALHSDIYQKAFQVQRGPQD